MNKQELLIWLEGFEAAISTVDEPNALSIIGEIITQVDLELDTTATATAWVKTSKLKKYEGNYPNRMNLNDQTNWGVHYNIGNLPCG